jgi:two-component system sensor histidine kinase ChiS
VQLKGKKERVSVFEIFDADSTQSQELKQQAKPLFEEGAILYNAERIDSAYQIFKEILQINSQDKAANFYIKSCEKFLTSCCVSQ